MKCPHCLESFFPDWTEQQVMWPENRIALDADKDTLWFLRITKCPSCLKLVMYLNRKYKGKDWISENRLMQPKVVARASLPTEVPSPYENDYKEACTVLADSAKASAALSRRCLQHLLREVGKTKKRDLFDQIDEVIPTLPSYLAEAVDAVRNIGISQLTRSKAPILARSLTWSQERRSGT